MAQLPLNALRAFEAAARLGSFNAAAEALFVTQSAISHQIRHLEEWLGAPLFSRGGRRPRILPHGEVLARSLDLSFSEIAAACQRAGESQGPQTLVIAAIPSVAICWLIPRLKAFRAQHPDIEIRVIYAMHGREVDFRDVHLAFVFADGMPAKPGLTAMPFLPGASVPVCSPALADGLGGQLPSAAAILASGLLHDTDATGWQVWLHKAQADVPAQLPGPVFEDFNLLRAAALSGQGIALCPVAMIRDDLDTGRLVQLSSISVLEQFNYYLVSGNPAEPSIRIAMQAFTDWVLASRNRPDAGPRLIEMGNPA